MVSARFGALPLLIAALTAPAALRLSGRSQEPRPLALSLSPPKIGPGDVVRLRLNGNARDRITGTAFGQQLTFVFNERDDAWRALAGVDLETKPGTYRVRVERNGAVSARTIRVTPRRFTIRRLRVPNNFVVPPREALEQIAADNKLVSAAYARATDPRWTGAFVLPVDGVPTSNFGTRSYYNGVRRSPHAGVDFMSKPGTPIRASNHGTVALAAPLYFTGNTVVIDHGGRLLSVFAHLSEFHVKAEDVVAPETIVGLVGATGRVTGPHLHWSVRLNGARVDPLSLIAATQP
jgi:murein DD-endopeptidase MepM/ murein hydrolase activator NlpD